MCYTIGMTNTELARWMEGQEAQGFYFVRKAPLWKADAITVSSEVNDDGGDTLYYDCLQGGKSCKVKSWQRCLEKVTAAELHKRQQES